MQPDFWNDKRPAGVPSDIDLTAYKSVVEVFERSCKRFADRPAFSNMGVTLTYAEQLGATHLVDVATGSVHGAEALLRWRRADGVFVPPDQFLPAVERSERAMKSGSGSANTSPPSSMVTLAPRRATSS